MKKKIFITTKPRTGKSTVIKKIVDSIGKENCFGRPKSAKYFDLLSLYLI